MSNQVETSKSESLDARMDWQQLPDLERYDIDALKRGNVSKSVLRQVEDWNRRADELKASQERIRERLQSLVSDVEHEHANGGSAVHELQQIWAEFDALLPEFLCMQKYRPIKQGELYAEIQAKMDECENTLDTEYLRYFKRPRKAQNEDGHRQIRQEVPRVDEVLCIRDELRGEMHRIPQQNAIAGTVEEVRQRWEKRVFSIEH